MHPVQTVLYGSGALDTPATDGPVTGSTGGMIMADLKLLMSETKSSGERRAFYGLDLAGEKTTLRGRVFYVDGVNTVYRDADGNLYSVPTAE